MTIDEHVEISVSLNRLVLVVRRLRRLHDDGVRRRGVIFLLGACLGLDCWPSDLDALDWTKCDVVAFESLVI